MPRHPASPEVSPEAARALLGALSYHPEMPDDIATRRALLTTALVGALLPGHVPEGRMVRAWRGPWAGVGHVVDTMQAAGYNVRFMQSPFTWWAGFCRG